MQLENTTGVPCFFPRGKLSLKFTVLCTRSDLLAIAKFLLQISFDSFREILWKLLYYKIIEKTNNLFCCITAYIQLHVPQGRMQVARQKFVSLALLAKAALFYSPVDFTDALDLHQTVVKFIGWSIESDKITLLKIKFNQENCQQKDTPLVLKQNHVVWLIHQGVVLFRSSVESSMHRCTHQCDASVKSTDE